MIREDINLKPSRLTKGLKTRLNAQVDYINANFNRGMYKESIDMIRVMISNLNYLSEEIQKHKESQVVSEAMKQKHKEKLENIDRLFKQRNSGKEVGTK